MTGFISLFSALLLSSAALAAGPCPSGKTQWQDWNRVRVEHLFTGDFREYVVNSIVENVELCQPELKAAPAFAECVSPLSRFAKSRWWDLQKGHSMGASFSDADYFDKVPYAEFLELPQELKDPDFLSWVEDERETANLEKALAYIERLNAAKADDEKWITFLYRSQHLATPDQTGALGRFFVYVPGKDFDRYFQFGLRSNPADELPKAFSVVSVQKTDPSTGKPLPIALARAKDFWRLRRSNGIELSTRFKVKGALENCYRCHKSAVLPIAPDKSVFDEKRFGEKMRLVNRLMKRHASATLFGSDPESYGPGLGPLNPPSRTDNFMKACANGRIADPARLAVIQSAMNCQKCHDGSDRGLLNFPSAKTLQPQSRKTLVHQYVIDHEKMPPGVKLSHEEREVLAGCLKQEFYDDVGGSVGLLKSYLLNESCWNSLP